MKQNDQRTLRVTAHPDAAARDREAEPDMRAVRERALGLVGRMSTDEKLSLVVTHFPPMAGAARGPDMPMCSGYNSGLPRLNVPALRLTDASLGVANVLNMRPDDTATALPSSLATAASFDPDLARAGGAMIGAEARAKGFNVMLAGGINLTRDPWGGRTFEYLGEDPLLSGLLGGAAVAGIQGNAIVSTVKHYVLNSQETGRMAMDARIDLASLRESDLLAFEIAIERGRPAAVMTAYNQINGRHASESAVLVEDILKGEWAFPGWVMSDWGGVHSVDAARCGLDQESGLELDVTLNGAAYFTGPLRDAIRNGQVPESRLDEMAARILTGLIATGAMDDPVPASPQPVDAEAHAHIAQRIAEAGIVLLRNEDGALPLPSGLRRIAVIGGHADIGVLSGGGSSQVRSIGGTPLEKTVEDADAVWFSRMTLHASSPLETLRALAAGAEVTYTDGTDPAVAVEAARIADVAILFATQWRSEHSDLQTLSLPECQDELIARVAEVNRRTIVVLESGGPVLMPWLDEVSAVLAAWYPGQRGGEAIARVLLGEVNPSGRLPMTFPASDAQPPRSVPPGLSVLAARKAARAAGDAEARTASFPVDYVEGANVGYRWYELTERPPLFPFGFGLSYTRFDYVDLAVEHEAARVTVRVTNEGERVGADVAQVYVRAADGRGISTWRLAGFRRVELEAGASRRVEIDLEPRTWSRWDIEAGGWRADGELALAVGRSSRDFVLEGVIRYSRPS